MYKEETLTKLILEYHKGHAPSLKTDLEYYATFESLDLALRAAARAERSDGKRHSHQYRLPAGEKLFHLVYPSLSNQQANFKSAKDFDEVFEIAKRAIAHKHRIGPLMVYDTSLRIAANLNLRPEKVYLHNGTKKGAENFFRFLLNQVLCKGADCIEAKRFLGLESFSASDIENFLCIMKDKFSGDSKNQLGCGEKDVTKTSRC